jgi:hypothetical protein
MDALSALRTAANHPTTALTVTRLVEAARPLRNTVLDPAQGEDPQFSEVHDRDGDLAGWDIWVADGQGIAFVPRYCTGGGEPSDGPDNCDVRNAIIAAGGLMTDAARELVLAQEVIRSMTDLVRRAARGASRRSRRAPRWAHVRDLFAVGSTSARGLCVSLGLDPDEEVGVDLEGGEE